jgi:hypothetical protein
VWKCECICLAPVDIIQLQTTGGSAKRNARTPKVCQMRSGSLCTQGLHTWSTPANTIGTHPPDVHRCCVARLAVLPASGRQVPPRPSPPPRAPSSAGPAWVLGMEGARALGRGGCCGGRGWA